jgi:hypothetical protein
MLAKGSDLLVEASLTIPFNAVCALSIAENKNKKPNKYLFIKDDLRKSSNKKIRLDNRDGF